MADLSTIRSAVQQNLVRERAPSTEDTAVTRWINQAVREDICAVNTWTCMATRQSVYLTANVGLFAWPEPLLWKAAHMIGIRQATTDPYRRMREVTLAQIVHDARSYSTGIPQWWAKQGDACRVAPLPDVSATYQIDVVGEKYLPDLAADSDSNYFTLRFSALVEYQATARGMLTYGEATKAARWMELAGRQLSKARTDDVSARIQFEGTLIPGTAAGRQRLPGRRGHQGPLVGGVYT